LSVRRCLRAAVKKKESVALALSYEGALRTKGAERGLILN